MCEDTAYLDNFPNTLNWHKIEFNHQPIRMADIEMGYVRCMSIGFMPIGADDFIENMLICL